MIETAAVLLYLWTATAGEARALCQQFGVEAARAETRAFANGDGRVAPLLRARGCYIPPGIIVCQVGDEVCRLHEERHHREGRWHP